MWGVRESWYGVLMKANREKCQAVFYSDKRKLKASTILDYVGAGAIYLVLTAKHD